MIHRQHITGLVLAGGRGSRMGGVDKGLQSLEGQPLVQHALNRLEPQVGPLMINANRHLEIYAGFGVPVCPDGDDSFAGPLAGVLAGLRQCETDWLVTVPCDTPKFPEDLVSRLYEALEGASIAIAVTTHGGVRQRQPVFCLLRQVLSGDLAAYLGNGGRKIEPWLDQNRCRDVLFDDEAAFFNANTLPELRQLGQP
jgi:molybdopterin-guanine dinucleotide biosynthesis protein A